MGSRGRRRWPRVAAQLGDTRSRIEKLEAAFQKIKNVTGVSEADAIVSKFLGRDTTIADLEVRRVRV